MGHDYSKLLLKIQKIQEQRRIKAGAVVELMTPNGIKTLSHDSAEGPRKANSLLTACSDAVAGIDSEGARIVRQATASRGPSNGDSRLLELMHMVIDAFEA